MAKIEELAQIYFQEEIRRCPYGTVLKRRCPKCGRYVDPRDGTYSVEGEFRCRECSRADERCGLALMIAVFVIAAIGLVVMVADFMNTKS